MVDSSSEAGEESCLQYPGSSEDARSLFNGSLPIEFAVHELISCGDIN